MIYGVTRARCSGARSEAERTPGEDAVEHLCDRRSDALTPIAKPGACEHRGGPQPRGDRPRLLRWQMAREGTPSRARSKEHKTRMVAAGGGRSRRSGKINDLLTVAYGLARTTQKIALDFANALK